MCARITLLTGDELGDVLEAVRARQALRALRAVSSAARGQARVGSEVPTIAMGSNGPGLARLVWGIQPPWSKKTIFNTRIESALGKGGMWERPIREGRCLVPAAAFYEAHSSETVPSPRTGRSMKRTYVFGALDEAALLLAGVQDAGRLSVVTTQPNADVAPVHPRMPLVLSFDEVPAWLEGSLEDIAQLADRSHVRLTAAPEFPAEAAGAAATRDQLTLF